MIRTHFCNKTNFTTKFKKQKWKTIAINTFTLFPIRFLAVGSIMITAALYAQIPMFLYRETKLSNGDVAPLSKWRQILITPTGWMYRALLFACGFHWIKVTGKPASRKQAPIMVSNHVNMFETMYLAATHIPMSVAKAELKSIPLFRTMLQCSQSILVKREHHPCDKE